MDADLRRELREYAWNYFKLHADQRMRAFGFFVLLSSAIVGGFITLISSPGPKEGVWALPLGLLLLSFVFWKFEERTRALVKNGENALKSLDEELGLGTAGQPHPIMMFHLDDRITDSLPRYPIVTGHFSYSRCIRWVLGFFAILGAVGALMFAVA